MDPITQDVQKLLDLTGEETISATQINQIVDTARMAVDKGLILQTSDTAPSTPVVPNPNGSYDGGITPTWWKRYLWVRLLSGGGIKLYFWDDTVVSGPTYLKWVEWVNAVGLDSRLSAVEVSIVQALADSSTALSTAEGASQDATAAVTTANAAQAAVTALANQVNTIANSFVRTGMCIPYAGQEVFSTTEDQGWLNCEGGEVSKTVFANLYAAIGDIFGVASNPTLNFKLPDGRGRAAIGSGTGSGLTARAKGFTGGNETVLLTAAQSGVPAHVHTIPLENGPIPPNKAIPAGTGFRLVGTAYEAVDTTIALDVLQNTPANAAQSHDNMQPSICFGRWVIKT